MLREQEFVVSVQLDPPLGANNSALIEAGRTLRESGKAHFVDVNDNPRARARMSGIMASVAIERDAGIETIPHLTTRDMSVAGLESLLLGAHAEGCTTSSPSPATRPRTATTRARAASTRSTRSA